MTTGAIRRAKLQSNHYHQQTNTQCFTGRMPFLSPNQKCESTEGKYHIPRTCSPGGLPTLSLTTNSSWLPWGRVAMPLISPLMPVSKFFCNSGLQKNSHCPFLQRQPAVSAKASGVIYTCVNHFALLSDNYCLSCCSFVH